MEQVAGGAVVVFVGVAVGRVVEAGVVGRDVVVGVVRGVVVGVVRGVVGVGRRVVVGLGRVPVDVGPAVAMLLVEVDEPVAEALVGEEWDVAGVGLPEP